MVGRLRKNVPKTPPHTIYTRIRFAEQLPPGSKVYGDHTPNPLQALGDKIGVFLAGFAFIDISYGDFSGNGIAKVHNEENLLDAGIDQ